MKKTSRKIKNRMWIKRLEKIVKKHRSTPDEDLASQGIKNYPECQKCRVFRDMETRALNQQRETNICAFG